MLLCLGGLTLLFKSRNKAYREGRRGPLEGTEGFYYTL